MNKTQELIANLNYANERLQALDVEYDSKKLPKGESYFKRKAQIEERINHFKKRIHNLGRSGEGPMTQIIGYTYLPTGTHLKKIHKVHYFFIGLKLEEIKLLLPYIDKDFEYDSHIEIPLVKPIPEIEGK